MKISFHGAARTVTGSKHLLHLSNDRNVLLDCGMFQGMGKDTTMLNSEWGFDPRLIDAVVLSHAHIDHSGLLPKLVKDGFHGKIYCTPATAELSKVLLVDSARIQENDLNYVNKHRAREGKSLYEPLYMEEDAINVFPLFEPIPYGQYVQVDEQMELMFTDCGHIIGSAAIHLKIKEAGAIKHITFSGDIGRYRDMILRSPDVFPQADVILMESTYGDTLHDASSPAIDKFLDHIVQTCLRKKGRLVIPAFSLGRTQEILYMLNRLEQQNRLPSLNYYVDSPLSIAITGLVKKYPEYFNTSVRKLLKEDEDVFAFKGLHYVQDVKDSIALNEIKEPCVIISASGMAEAGRVKHHIAHTIENSRNTILFTGYCEPQSLGGRLKAKPAEVTIFSKRYSVKANISEITSLSAHGDYDDLCQWLACQQPNKVKQLFLVHGEYEVQLKFRQKLNKKGFKNVIIPGLHETVSLDMK